MGKNTPNDTEVTIIRRHSNTQSFVWNITCSDTLLIGTRQKKLRSTSCSGKRQLRDRAKAMQAQQPVKGNINRAVLTSHPMYIHIYNTCVCILSNL